jgi:predicted lactoylglutathione lyase
MLLVEKRFQDFARKPIADATRATDGILAITADSRAEVDELLSTALTSC